MIRFARKQRIGGIFLSRLARRSRQFFWRFLLNRIGCIALHAMGG